MHFLLSLSFAFSRVSCGWNPTVRTAFSGWLPSLTNMHLMKTMVLIILSEVMLLLNILVIRTLIVERIP